MFAPVPAAPPALAEPPLSFSFSVLTFIGTPFLAYVSSSRVVWSTLRSALTCTRALLAPSVLVSIELRLDSSARSKRASAACLDEPDAAGAARGVALRPQELAGGVGDRDVVLLEALDGGGRRAGRCPATAPDSIVSAGLPSITAAVAGVSVSANRSSSGSTSCTWASLTPDTPLTVEAISPSSARW